MWNNHQFFFRIKKLKNQIETPEGKILQSFVLFPSDSLEIIDTFNPQDIFDNNTDIQKELSPNDSVVIIGCHKTQYSEIEFFTNIDSEYYHNLVEILESFPNDDSI